MAKRRLASLGLDDDLLLQCARNSLKTIQNVLELSPLDVMKKLRLSADQSRALQLQLCQYCAPSRQTAWSLLQEQRALGLGSSTLDSLLGGGLQHGAITELAGPAGVGKTQWCVEVTVRCLLRNPHRVTPVIFIDTEAAFTPSRLVEVLTQRLSSEEHHKIPELLANVFVHQPNTVSGLEKIVSQLEVQAAESGAGVVVVDSIASLARKEFPPHRPGVEGGAWRRVLVMAGWAARLKTLAATRDLAVLVTNQVTSRRMVCDVVSEDEAEQDEAATTTAEGGEESAKTGTVQSCEFVIPALGNTWTHFVNTRLILQYTEDLGTRQLVIAKSPVAPFATFGYSIHAAGVTVQGEGNYSYRGSDPGLHRIQVQPGPPL